MRWHGVEKNPKMIIKEPFTLMVIYTYGNNIPKEVCLETTEVDFDCLPPTVHISFIFQFYFIYLHKLKSNGV